MIVLFWFYVIPSLLTITFFLIKKYCCGKVIMRFKCIEYKNVNLYHGHSVITHEYKPVIYSKANIRGKFENYWYIYPYSLGKQINYWNFTKTYTRKRLLMWKIPVSDIIKAFLVRLQTCLRPVTQSDPKLIYVILTRFLSPTFQTLYKQQKIWTIFS